MPRYTSESVERVREAIDMVDLVGSRVELRRGGPGRYTGQCPFHDDRTPSFGIDAAKKVYFCFGCQAGGDAFRFVMETEGLDFARALEALADRYRVPLEVEDEDPAAAGRRRRRERLLALLDRTATFYSRTLFESPAAAGARSYLADRSLDPDVLRAFRVGFAPDSFDRVLSASRAAGYSDEELLAAGLVGRARDGQRLYDRFRGRVVFPLADARGRVRGFGARALRADQTPKYLNTSEGEVFHKGAQLFGVDQARAEAARAAAVVLVEGYTDVLALHQAGIRNVVAAMGTALTEEQVAGLARLAPRVLLALDADEAGRRAMVRAAAVARKKAHPPLELRVVPLPAGDDPADLVARSGADAVRALLERSIGFAEFHTGWVLDAADLGSAEGKDAALAELAPIVRDLPAGVRRDELVRTISSRLEVAPALVADVLARAPSPSPSRAPGRSPSPSHASVPSEPRVPRPAAPARREPLDRRERTERTFLALCIALPGPGRGALAALDLEQHFTGTLVRRAAAHLREHLDAPLADLPDGDEPLARLIGELTVRADTGPSDEDALEIERLQLEKARLDREIAAARAAGRLDIPDLARARGEVQERLDAAIDRAMTRS